jgi:hypothetical protein
MPAEAKIRLDVFYAHGTLNRLMREHGIGEGQPLTLEYLESVQKYMIDNGFPADCSLKAVLAFYRGVHLAAETIQKKEGWATADQPSTTPEPPPSTDST